MLKGLKLADLTIDQPRTFDFVVNANDGWISWRRFYQLNPVATGCVIGQCNRIEGRKIAPNRRSLPHS
jgi:hypothetical protein